MSVSGIAILLTVLALIGLFSLLRRPQRHE